MVAKAGTSRTKDYTKIAAAKISRPSERPARLPRILVYSRNKKGKTQLCTTAPDVLIADPEGGTDQMVEIDPRTWKVENWQDIDDLYKYLKLGDHDYKWVSLDGVTRMHNMALRWVMSQAEERDISRKPGVVDRRDYGKAGELTKGMLHNFNSLPMGVIFTAQERQEAPFDEAEDDDDSAEATTSFVPDIPKGARAALNSIVDVIGRLYVVRVDSKTEDRQVIQRRLWVEPHPAYDTGYRSDFVLPAFIKNPTIPKIVQLIQQGKVSR